MYDHDGRNVLDSVLNGCVVGLGGKLLVEQQKSRYVLRRDQLLPRTL